MYFQLCGLRRFKGGPRLLFLPSVLTFLALRKGEKQSCLTKITVWWKSCRGRIINIWQPNIGIGGWLNNTWTLFLKRLHRYVVGVIEDFNLAICMSFSKIGPFPASFSLFFVFSTVNCKYVHYKILPLTGFEPQTSGVGSNLSANWATTNSQNLYELRFVNVFYSNEVLITNPVHISCT